jgi:hypothetical protein
MGVAAGVCAQDHPGASAWPGTGRSPGASGGAGPSSLRRHAAQSCRRGRGARDHARRAAADRPRPARHCVQPPRGRGAVVGASARGGVPVARRARTRWDRRPRGSAGLVRLAHARPSVHHDTSCRDRHALRAPTGGGRLHPAVPQDLPFLFPPRQRGGGELRYGRPDAGRPVPTRRARSPPRRTVAPPPAAADRRGGCVPAVLVPQLHALTALPGGVGARAGVAAARFRTAGVLGGTPAPGPRAGTASRSAASAALREVARRRTRTGVSARAAGQDIINCGIEDFNSGYRARHRLPAEAAAANRARLPRGGRGHGSCSPCSSACCSYWR